jgi:hypothetical protein
LFFFFAEIEKKKINKKSCDHIKEVKIAKGKT